MNRKRLLIALGILLALVLAVPLIVRSVCGTVFIKPAAPTGQPIPLATVLQAETSQVALEANFLIAELQQLLNREVPTNFKGAQKQDLTSLLSDDYISWDIDRGEVVLKNNGERILVGAPLTGEVKAGGKVFGSFPMRGTVDLQAGVVGAIAPNLAEDWDLEPNAALELKLQKANMNIGSASVDISGFLQGAIAKEITKLLGQLQPALNKEEGWKRTLNQVWGELHRVEQVESDPPLWISIRPTGIAMRPLDYADQSQIRAVFQIDVEVIAHLTEPPVPALSPLAALRIDPNLAIKSQLRVPAMLPLARVNEILKTQVIEFEIADQAEVELTDLRIEVQSANEVNLHAHFTASRGLMKRRIDGTLWLKGQPRIDLERQELAFADLDFTMETQSALESSAVWLLKPGLRNELDRALRFDISKELKKATESANKALQDFERPQGLEGTVKIDELAIEDVYLIRASETEDALVVVLAAEAAATLKVGLIDLEELK